MTGLCGDVPEGLYELTQLRHLELGFHEPERRRDEVTLGVDLQAETALQGLIELTSLTKLNVTGAMDDLVPIGLSCLAKLESFCYLGDDVPLYPGFSLGAHLTELQLHCTNSSSLLDDESDNGDEEVRNQAACLLRATMPG